jgi:hypothetical protein
MAVYLIASFPLIDMAITELCQVKLKSMTQDRIQTRFIKSRNTHRKWAAMFFCFYDTDFASFYDFHLIY